MPNLKIRNDMKSARTTPFSAGFTPVRRRWTLGSIGFDCNQDSSHGLAWRREEGGLSPGEEAPVLEHSRYLGSKCQILGDPGQNSRCLGAILFSRATSSERWGLF
jgi:hypothetical protein